MDAVTGHDVGGAAEDGSGTLFEFHQSEQAELDLLVIEKKIDIGRCVGSIARGRSEQVKAFDAEASQVGFVLLQPGYGFIACHDRTITGVPA